MVMIEIDEAQVHVLKLIFNKGKRTTRLNRGERNISPLRRASAFSEYSIDFYELMNARYNQAIRDLIESGLVREAKEATFQLTREGVKYARLLTQLDKL
jgi:hypothetical protein